MIEHVITEHDYYDGPKSGIALFKGAPHRFSAAFDESRDDYSEIFLIWPIEEADLRLEVEQWRIFVAWNDRYEKGNATTESHPAHGGIDARWDEIGKHLANSREPHGCEQIRAYATFHRIDREKRYTESGPDYGVEWTAISGAV